MWILQSHRQKVVPHGCLGHVVLSCQGPDAGAQLRPPHYLLHLLFLPCSGSSGPLPIGNRPSGHILVVEQHAAESLLCDVLNLIASRNPLKDPRVELTHHVLTLESADFCCQYFK
ncbi:Hypothetical protein FKW44_018087 [Caligus rogercresseyi]|uniref:Uncharacterized protein n=1 Tax=Caligus rogercresseyi TaxID=217165 RepID=A0A7T8GUA6_CALRO|nr:Hypothetical protein FKW44_018087 [Caligus rogercresseyi]